LAIQVNDPEVKDGLNPFSAQGQSFSNGFRFLPFSINPYSEAGF
jgi:hypothetical protein